MKKEYHIQISGVHYAANPEAEAGMPDTEAMHVRTRELLSKIDRERPLVSLFAEPTNLFNPDCIMAFSRGKRIGRVADECVGEVKSLLAQSEDPILFSRVEEVTIKEHGHLSGGQHEAGKAYETFRRHEAENDRYLEFEVKKLS